RRAVFPLEARVPIVRQLVFASLPVPQSRPPIAAVATDRTLQAAPGARAVERDCALWCGTDRPCVPRFPDSRSRAAYRVQSPRRLEQAGMGFLGIRPCRCTV